MFALYILLSAFHLNQALEEEDVIPGTLVKFQWTDKSWRAQINEEIIRRAKALDGRICVIMERALYFDETRIRIQSVDDPELTLAVKLKHLEIARPSSELHIDLLVSRLSKFGDTYKLVHSGEYVYQEVQIANDAEYDMVFCE